MTNQRIRDLIINGEKNEKTFYNIIRESSFLGMQTFDQDLINLYGRGLITEESVLRYASSRSEINRSLDRIKSMRGESTSDLMDLTME